MARKSRTSVPVLTEEEKRAMAETLVPILKGETPVYRGNEREALISYEAPAIGRATSHTVALVNQGAKLTGIRRAHAIRVHESANKDIITCQLLAKYDPNASDQYKLNWYEGYRFFTVQMIEIFQPRNLQVAPGYVFEVPASLEDLPVPGPNGAAKTYYLMLHVGQGATRKREEAVAKSPAASIQN